MRESLLLAAALIVTRCAVRIAEIWSARTTARSLAALTRRIARSSGKMTLQERRPDGSEWQVTLQPSPYLANGRRRQ
jgi:hypothetical protein